MKGMVLLPMLIGILFVGGAFLAAVLNVPTATSMRKFSSCVELSEQFHEGMMQAENRGYGIMEQTLGMPSAGADIAKSGEGAEDYSTTNIQVAGVDEADIVKTDGEYIYTLSGGKLVISRAYPAEDAEVLSSSGLGDLHPQEIFIYQEHILMDKDFLGMQVPQI